MPFKDRHHAAPIDVFSAPRRLAGIAVAGSVPSLDAALSAGPLSQVAMCFNEFCNMCVSEALALASQPLVALDWFGGGEFLLCWAGPVEAAAAFCRAFAEHRPEFARVHRWPQRAVIGVSAGELIFSGSGADGRRVVRAFGDPIGRARKLTRDSDHAAPTAGRDTVIYAAELEAFARSHDDDSRLRVVCA